MHITSFAVYELHNSFYHFVAALKHVPINCSMANIPNDCVIACTSFFPCFRLFFCASPLTRSTSSVNPFIPLTTLLHSQVQAPCVITNPPPSIARLSPITGPIICLFLSPRGPFRTLDLASVAKPQYLCRPQ